MAQIKRQLEQWVVEDRERRRQAALAEGMRNLLTSLLEHKFGVQSKGTYLAILNQMQDVEQFQQLSRWAMDCDTLEELMRKIDRDKT